MPWDNEEKTESPTPKRRSEAKQKGQVARSIELNSAVILLTSIIFFYFAGNFLFNNLTSTIKLSFQEINQIEFTQKSIENYSIRYIVILFKTILPLMLAVIISGIFINLLQVGIISSTEIFNINLNRINPLKGILNIFSGRTVVELIKSIIKIITIGFIGYQTWSDEYKNMVNLIDKNIMDLLPEISKTALKMGLRICSVFFLIALFDYLYQRWEFEKSLKMTKFEVKEEYKQTEGDPLIKARVKILQRQYAQRRMMMELPKADFIVTNPVHYAVALLYKKEKMRAPEVIAKGARLIAERMVKIAGENGIPVVQNPALAQILYKTVDIGKEIPANLYKAVAEILAYVYFLKKKIQSNSQDKRVHYP